MARLDRQRLESCADRQRDLYYGHVENLEELARSFAELWHSLEWSYGDASRHAELTQDERDILGALEKRLYKLIARKVLTLPERLYHFTTKEGLAGILSSGGIHATYWRDLVDQHEIRHGMALVDCAMQYLRSRLQPQLQEFLGLLYYSFVQRELTQEYYMVCFTDCAESKRHWEEYDPVGSGFVIGFDAFKLRSATWDVQPVIYTMAEKADLIIQVVDACWVSALDLVRTSKDRLWVWVSHIMNLLSTHLHWHLSLVKQDEFAWEREWRIVLRGDKPANKVTAVKRFTSIPLLTKPHVLPIIRIASRNGTTDLLRALIRLHGYDASELAR